MDIVYRCIKDKKNSSVKNSSVKILNIGIDRYEQIMLILIRLLLKEQSDQGLHCLPFLLHFWQYFGIIKPNFFHFRAITVYI